MSAGVDERERCDVLVLGGGLAGLSAASSLGDRAIVLERDERPGGLVRTRCHDGYWFDDVIHILYLPDDDTERRVLSMMRDVLAPCPPVAFVQTNRGTTRYPFQANLGGLDRDAIVECVRDLAEVTFGPQQGPPRDFEAMLRQTFGRAMCEIFFLPYNRKVWKRPLGELISHGSTWTIERPAFDRVVAGAVSTSTEYRAYNAGGWYPRPERSARQRGMELLSERLAARVDDLRLGQRVERIDVARREVIANDGNRRRQIHYREQCCCTLPMPQALSMCPQTPAHLRRACSELTYNRVVSVGLRVQGPRPSDTGHWRYYADESLCFTRLVFMHEFDPDLAPPDGWGLLAEIVEPAEWPLVGDAKIVERVIADVERAGALPADCRVSGAHVRVVDPAYVVFTPRSREIVDEGLAFLRSHDVEPLGRYGRWEYSSMGQVMRDAFAWADSLSPAPEIVVGEALRPAARAGTELS